MTNPAATTHNAFPGAATPAELLYSDLGQELAMTRRMLERVPEGKDDWKPHAKSMSLAALANHVAGMPEFTHQILSTNELDFETADFGPDNIANTADRLARFDAGAATLTTGIANADWTTVAGQWTMRAGDVVYMTDRKASLLRTLGISHMAHHRAQLGVYLRQLDIAIPGPYGPSADET